MTKKSREKLKYLENDKSFWGEIKSIFHHFEGLSMAESCLRPENVHLTNKGSKLYCIMELGQKFLNIFLSSYFPIITVWIP